MTANFTPVMDIAPIDGWNSLGLVAYAAFLLIAHRTTHKGGHTVAHFEIKDLTFSYASAKGKHRLEECQSVY